MRSMPEKGFLEEADLITAPDYVVIKAAPSHWLLCNQLPGSGRVHGQNYGHQRDAPLGHVNMPCRARGEPTSPTWRSLAGAGSISALSI